MILSPRIALLLCLLTLPLSPIVQAQADDDAERVIIETITLNHRAPDGIRQAILPTLLPGARIAQIGEHLIIASTRGNVEQLRAMVERLDTPPRELQLRVDFAHQPGADVAAPLSDEPEATDSDLAPNADNRDTTPTVPENQILRQVLEDETLILQYAPDSAPEPADQAAPAQRQLYLALRLTVLSSQQIQLSYGYSDTDNVVADMLQLLSPGQWQILGDEGTDMLVTPLEFALGEAANDRQLAIRVDILP